MRRWSTLLAVGAVVTSLITGCGGGTDSDDGADPTDQGTSGLIAALSRVAPIDGMNLSVYFENSGVLTELLAGREPVAEPPKYDELVGFGAVGIAGTKPITESLGIDLSAAEYAITVGAPPSQYALVSGGQDGETITSELSGHGWAAEGDQLVAPTDIGSVEQEYARYILSMSRVRVDESELIYGGADADLSLVDGEADSLADDERVSAVAGCLGDVVAATIHAVELRDATPMVGMAVRIPTDADQRPRVVVCTAWESAEQAVAYADRAKADLAEGRSPSGQPYAEILDPTDEVSVVDAVASWQTQSDLASTIFTMWAGGGIPGVWTSCDHLTPEQLAAMGDVC